MSEKEYKLIESATSFSYMMTGILMLLFVLAVVIAILMFLDENGDNFVYWVRNTSKKKLTWGVLRDAMFLTTLKCESFNGPELVNPPMNELACHDCAFWFEGHCIAAELYDVANRMDRKEYVKPHGGLPRPNKPPDKPGGTG